MLDFCLINQMIFSPRLPSNRNAENFQIFLFDFLFCRTRVRGEENFFCLMFVFPVPFLNAFFSFFFSSLIAYRLLWNTKIFGWDQKKIQKEFNQIWISFFFVGSMFQEFSIDTVNDLESFAVWNEKIIIIILNLMKF